MGRGKGGKGGKGGNEVVFVRPDCAFGGVSAVVGEWDVLELDGWGRLAEKIERSSLVSLSKMR